MGRFTHLPEVETILAQGETKSSVRLSTGIQVDLRVISEKEYPYALIYFTGSKEHNTILRGIAKDKGLKLNEYGLYRGEKLIECKDEAQIYKALGMEYIPPELREGVGEISAAEKDKIPDLIDEKDLQGVFHVHSTWSDGTASIQKMAETAQKLGFKYMGLSDHSQSAKYAGGLTAADLKKQHAEIDAVEKKMKGFKIFKGIESDILSDGSLDYPEKILENFDFVIASVHSGFKMSEGEMTKRLVRVLENPHTTMLGHMTGRLLLAREGYAFNLDKVLETAAKHGKVIEINANPHRFDIDRRWIQKASSLGVKFSINPDAHSPEGLKDTAFGVGIARKGWLTKNQVVNTMPLSEMEKFLAR
jgi:DNA polymerase (family 10)